MICKKYEEEVEEAKANISLVMTKKLKDKLDYLSTEYTKSEISGFITCSNIEQDKDGETKIILDDLLIPPQDAKYSEVDVDGNGLIALRKEYGDKCLNIIGHWHSHHTMGCFFSSTDEDMMNGFSGHKPFNLFIVSSMGEHLIRMVLRNTFKEMPIKFIIENVSYEVEIDSTIKTEMEDEIKRKVKEVEVKVSTYSSNNSDAKDNIKKIKKEIATRIKYMQHQNHKVKVENIFKEYANLISEEFKHLSPIIEKSEIDKHYSVIVELGDKNKAKEFMCDVKEFLLQQLLSETKTNSKIIPDKDLEDMSEEEKAGLEEYMSELDDEEFDEMNYRGSYNNYANNEYRYSYSH